MSHHYRAISWTPFKRRYDLILSSLIVTFLGVFILLGTLFYPEATGETLLIRGLGVTALLLLHLTLMIGPLTRLNRRWLPLLYNRRHLGILTFIVALLHGTISLFQFHALGDTNPLVSVLLANPRWDSLSQFPFQPLGLAALVILLLLAATSHDFWLTVLHPSGWKRLHMLVYVAYVLVVLHVALGILRVEPSSLYPALLAMGVVAVIGVHLAAGWKEWRRDHREVAVETDGYAQFCRVDEIHEGRAQIRLLAGERVAVFRSDGQFSAVSNVCPHQHGPLGEGAVINGYITCPWHGFQFEPLNGCAPAPFADRVSTYDVQVRGGCVWVKADANPLGTEAVQARLQPQIPPARRALAEKDS